MKLARSSSAWLLAPASLILLSLALSCSKSNSSYTPTNPGGTTAELSSGTLSGSGAGYQHTFLTAGSFPYHCAIHGAGMAGTVTVSASSAVDSVLVSFGPGLAYNPASVSVKPGGYVRWLNSSGTAHTVTSN